MRNARLELTLESAGYVEQEPNCAYVIEEEGTYNPANGHFACDSDYIALGQPSSRSGWKCP